MSTGLKKTTEQFVQELKSIFKDKPYTFDKVVYTGARNYVIATCTKHGDWRVMATNLQQGKGCKGCASDKTGDIRRKDLKHFITKSKKVHGDRYDYSEVVYVSNHTPVKIICEEHGVFEQQPVAHYSGSGCTLCVKRIFGTLRDIKNSLNSENLKLWDFIDYNDDDKVIVTDKVKVYCKKHFNYFNTNFASLMERKSCCDVIKCQMISDSQKKEYSEHLKEIIDIHGERYSYPNDLGLVTIYDKINIMCKEHGIFKQTIYHHTKRKQGCPECARVERGLSKSKTWLSKLDERLSEIDLGDGISVVDTSNLKKSTSKITFSCEIHGEFKKSLGNLKLGQRCPECSFYEGWGKQTYIERSKDIYNGLCNLYYLKCWKDDEVFYKIGITVHSDIRRRFTKSTIPYDYEVLSFITDDVEKVVDWETFMHKELKEFRYSPIIPFGGSCRECFSEDGCEKALELLNMFNNEVERPI